MPPAKPKRRLVLMDFRLVEALADVLQGITSYVKTRHLDWQVQCVDAAEFDRSLGRPGIDGAITVIAPQSRDRIDRVRASSVATVNMLHNLAPSLPSVLSDDRALGRSGAQYLLTRGFVHFAFLGIDTHWSAGRQRGFADLLTASGHRSHFSESIHRLADYRALDSDPLRTAIRDWIQGLPKPLAVMACTDLAARELLAICLDAGMRVPEDVAILGVDNAVATCELSAVSLSSVAQDFPKLGFEAARMLDRLMSGRQPPKRPALIPAGQLVVRRSTDVFAFEDPLVAGAMRMIHARAGEGLGIKELVDQLGVSRKWLDIRFKALTGHTPSLEIRTVRLSRIEDLLLNTDLPIQQIAKRCAFGCSENLIRFFRQARGVPPQQYRRQKRVL